MLDFYYVKERIFISIICIFISQVLSTTVRLVGGKDSYEGRVEVFHVKYGTVCDDDFGIQEATVICRMLNFGSSIPIAFSQAHFGVGNGSILLDDLGCTGSETDIADCRSKGWGSNNCQHSEDAGVRCEPVQLRLIGGGPLEGRLQIRTQNTSWGTVCGRQFNPEHAESICNILGHPTKYAHVTSPGRYAPDTGLIYNINMTCDNSTRGSCFFQTPSVSSCSHGDDVALKCAHELDTEMRLVDGKTPFDGRVEVKHNGIWGAICGGSLTEKEAKTICRNLGLLAESAQIVHGVTNVDSEGPVWISNLNCTGPEADIRLCSVTYNQDQCSRNSLVGVSCGHTAMRLVNGEGPWEGRLEVNHQGRWGSVCSDKFDINDAKLVCRNLGFIDSESVPEVLPNAYFGTGSGDIWLDDLNCTGSSLDISACLTSDWGVHNCSHYNDVGVRCATKLIRLVDGSHTMEGRVEVNIKGEWTTICDEHWDDSDATYVCRKLVKYPIDSLVLGKAFSRSFFGSGSGLIGMTKVDCKGHEHDIFNCTYEKPEGTICDHSNDAGVSCYRDISYDISFGSRGWSYRGIDQNILYQIPNENLVNSTTYTTSNQQPNETNTGTVQINLNGTLYSVCSENWDENDATVVCKSLGYWVTSPNIYVDSWFGNAYGTSLRIEPKCSGSESDIAFCLHGLEWGKDTCSHSKDAGMKCVHSPLGRENIRLVDGERPGRGRLEIFYNQQWRSLCLDKKWSDENIQTVCRMMNYDTVSGSHYQINHHPSPILTQVLQCTGSETDIGLCAGWMDHTSGDKCPYVVGVNCTGNVEVKTWNGKNPLEGYFEVGSGRDGNRTWEYFNTNTSDETMRVLCSSMGYSGTNPIKTSNPKNSFAPTDRPITGNAFDHSQCVGWEEHITQCRYSSKTVQSNGIPLYIKCFGCSKLFNSTNGTTHSLNYPSNYDNNVDCLTVIKPEVPGNYKLTVLDLLMNDNGDKLEIRDGQYGKQIGLYSSIGEVPIMTGKEFWIRFTTNGTGTARGYKLQWDRLTLEDTMHINCGPSNWNVVVNMTLLRALYPDSKTADLYISSLSCPGTVNGDTLVFNQSYTDCSTHIKTTDDRFVYTNQLIYPKRSSIYSPIIHGYKWRMNIQCEIGRQETATQHYKPTDPTTLAVTVPGHQIGGSSHLKVELSFFKDSGFYQEIHGNPILAHLGNNVYVKVAVNSHDPGVKMRLDTCVAKPSAYASSQYTYTLIKDGCSVDPDTVILSQGTHETRFKFNVFEFPVNHNDVFVSCNSTFCTSTDNSANCQQVCHSGRAIHEQHIPKYRNYLSLKEVRVHKVIN